MPAFSAMLGFPMKASTRWQTVSMRDCTSIASASTEKLSDPRCKTG